MLLKSKPLPMCVPGCLAAFLMALSSRYAICDENYVENAGQEGNGNIVIGPDYQIDPDLTDRGNPKGKYFEFAMRLADSKIFRGDDTTLDPRKPVREQRKIFVYIPAAYKNGTKAPLLITLDGPSRLNLVRNALDNLTISTDPRRRLPAFIAIGVENGGNDGKGSERGLEYDTLSDRFARFINDEVLPAVLNDNGDSSCLSEHRLHDQSLGESSDGLQFRRRCGPHDGLVSSGFVSPFDHLFRHIRRSAGR